MTGESAILAVATGLTAIWLFAGLFGAAPTLLAAVVFAVWLFGIVVWLSGWMVR